MLPPLNLLALDTGAFDADLGTWYGVQAPEAGFRATFSGMRDGALPADPALPEVFRDSTARALPLPAAGEGLPLPGQALPLEAPEVALSAAAPPDAPAIPEIPDLPSATGSDARERGAVLAPPSGPMQAQRSPLAGTSMPGDVLAGATAEPGEQAAARARQATVLDHIRYVTPHTAARVPAQVTPVDAPVDAPAEAATLPQTQSNPSAPSAVRDAAVPQPFVQHVAGPVAAKAGGAAAGALSRVDSQDTRPAPSSATPPPFISTAAPSLPPPWVASQVQTSPGQPGWSDALGERVTWMTGNKLQNVELRLNPAELGPVRVQISIDDGNATVNFNAQHPLTREAIEQALPRLRDMLADQGLSLQNATVSEGRRDDQSAPRRHDDLAGLASGRASPALKVEEGGVPAARHAVGLVDLFA